MNKGFSKLVAHVAHFLKAVGEGYAANELAHVEPEVRVEYNLENNEAYVYVSSHSYVMGNGVESTFDWSLVDRLTELSQKYKISYRIGTDQHGILHFQIYV